MLFAVINVYYLIYVFRIRFAFFGRLAKNRTSKMSCSMYTHYWPNKIFVKYLYDYSMKITPDVINIVFTFNSVSELLSMQISNKIEISQCHKLKRLY